MHTMVLKYNEILREKMWEKHSISHRSFVPSLAGNFNLGDGEKIKQFGLSKEEKDQGRYWPLGPLGESRLSVEHQGVNAGGTVIHMLDNICPDDESSGGECPSRGDHESTEPSSKRVKTTIGSQPVDSAPESQDRVDDQRPTNDRETTKSPQNTETHQMMNTGEIVAALQNTEDEQVTNTNETSTASTEAGGLEPTPPSRNLEQGAATSSEGRTTLASLPSMNAKETCATSHGDQDMPMHKQETNVAEAAPLSMSFRSQQPTNDKVVGPAEEGTTLAENTVACQGSAVCGGPSPNA